MIIHVDTIGTVPTFEHTTCGFHKHHPGKSFAGCSCSASFGRRKATDAERLANLRKASAELQEKIDDLNARKSALDSEAALLDRAIASESAKESE